MTAHTELGLRERRTIEDMLNAKMSVDKIAAEIGRHRSTVFREIKRNRFVDDKLPKLNGYDGMNARRLAMTWRTRRRKLVRFVDLRKHVITRLVAGWSGGEVSSSPSASALLRHPSQLVLQSPVLGLMIHVGLLWGRIAEQLHPLVERMHADPQLPGNLPNPIPPHRDLMHRIALELVMVIACPHLGLLALKLGGKASTKLGAPHYAGTQFSGIALIAIFITRFVIYIFLWDTIIMGITVGINTILSFIIGRYVTFNPPE